MISKINKPTLQLFYNNIPSKYQRIYINNALDSAIKSENILLIDFLLQNGAPIYHALNGAVITSNINVVDTVLKYNSSPAIINANFLDGTPLSIAVDNSYYHIINRLLSIPGINPSLYNMNKKTPLMLSFIRNNVEIATQILDFYGDNLKSQVWQLNKSLTIFLEKFDINDRNGDIDNNYSKYDINDIKQIKLVYEKWIPIIIRILKVENVDYNCFSDTFTLLSFACKYNEMEIVNILLSSNNVDPNLYGPGNGDTPLINAISSKNIEIVKKLIEYPQTDINMCNIDGKSPLLFAAKFQLTEIIDILIQNDKFDPVGSRLDEVFYKSDPPILSHLISAKSLDVNYFDIKVDNQSVIVRNGYVNPQRGNVIFGNLQQRYPSPYHKNYTVKLYNKLMALSCKKELFDMIIEHPSFDIEKSFGKTVLFLFTKIGKDEYFNKMLSFFNNDVNMINESGISILVYAAKEGNQNIVNRILNDDKFDCNKSQILYAFCSSFEHESIRDNLFEYIQNHTNIVEFTNLLPNGISIYNMLIDYKSNRYHIPKYINFFIENGVDPNIQDRNGFYPLEKSILNKSFEISEVLINSNKIDLNMKISSKITTSFINSIHETDINNLYGANSPNSNTKFNSDKAVYQSYLHLAIRNKKIFDLLLKQKTIDINITNNLGETPLITICAYDDIFGFITIPHLIVLLFESNKLDYHHKNNKGKDAIMMINSLLDESENIKSPQDKNEYLKELLRLTEIRIKNIRNRNRNCARIVDDNNFIDKAKYMPDMKVYCFHYKPEEIDGIIQNCLNLPILLRVESNKLVSNRKIYYVANDAAGRCFHMFTDKDLENGKLYIFTGTKLYSVNVDRFNNKIYYVGSIFKEIGAIEYKESDFPEKFTIKKPKKAKTINLEQIIGDDNTDANASSYDTDNDCIAQISKTNKNQSEIKDNQKDQSSTKNKHSVNQSLPKDSIENTSISMNHDNESTPPVISQIESAHRQPNQSLQMNNMKQMQLDDCDKTFDQQ